MKMIPFVQNMKLHSPVSLKKFAVFHTSILNHIKLCACQENERSHDSIRGFQSGAGFIQHDIHRGGGKFNEMKKAKEDEYFYKKTKEDIERLARSKGDKVELVKELIKERERDVKHYKKLLEELQEKVDSYKKRK